MVKRFYMKIFKPSDTTHTVTIIPRYFDSLPVFKIRDELKNIEVERNLNAVDESGYMTAEFEYEFREGGSYEIEMYNESKTDLLYRGKAYATDKEDLENYKLTTPL